MRSIVQIENQNRMNLRLPFILFLVILCHSTLSIYSQNCKPAGFAGYNGNVTGGGSSTPVTVKNLADFKSAASASGPKVILVDGNFGSGTDAVKVTSDKTIFGLPGAVFNGSLQITGAEGAEVKNVIIRNLKIVGPGAEDVNGIDPVYLKFAERVWLDHLEIIDGQDGSMDITHASDFVTVSWCKFNYTSKSRSHQFAILIGHSDNNSAEDKGKLRVTFQYNYWAEGVVERMPRVRYGQVHLVNNLIDNKGSSGTRAGREANLYIESNVYKGVSEPIDLYNNDFVGITSKDNLFIGTSGNQKGSGTSFTPPYTIEKISADKVEALVKSGAGATLKKLDECTITEVEESVLEEALIAYPNPFSEQLLINVLDGYQYNLSDLTGRNMISLTQGNHSLETTHLPAGLYYLQMVKGDRLEVIKLLKK